MVSKDMYDLDICGWKEYSRFICSLTETLLLMFFSMRSFASRYSRSTTDVCWSKDYLIIAILEDFLLTTGWNVNSSCWSFSLWILSFCNFSFFSFWSSYTRSWIGSRPDKRSDEFIVVSNFGLKLHSFMSSMSWSRFNFSRFSFRRSASCSSLSGKGKLSY